MSSLVLSFCFQMHKDCTCTSKTLVVSRLVCIRVLVSLSPRGNYKKYLQQSHVFTALCGSIGFIDMIGVCVFLCVFVFVCLLPRMAVGPISCYLHDNGAERHSFSHPQTPHKGHETNGCRV
jgi:hypothetical protein